MKDDLGTIFNQVSLLNHKVGSNKTLTGLSINKSSFIIFIPLDSRTEIDENLDYSFLYLSLCTSGKCFNAKLDAREYLGLSSGAKDNINTESPNR